MTHNELGEWGEQYAADYLVSKGYTLLDQYVISKDLDVEIRFDIIAVLKNGKREALEHFEDAFYHF